MTKNVAQQVLDAVNLEAAVKLRIRGAHWREIADACGYPSPAAALTAVGAALAASTSRTEASAAQYRDEAELRLTGLLRSTMDMLEEPAPETYDADGNPLGTDDRAVRLRAVDEARRLILEMARLHGVDKPAKSEETVNSGIRIIGVAVEDAI